MYIAVAFERTYHVGIGGPNIPPCEQGFVADAVARAPGGPIHVLLTDEEAEHVPGCNMAFRRTALIELGGFDSRVWVAGDDVDICWRIRQRGWTLGYHAGAVVWHERRESVRAFAHQQRGYGRAEALLARKWPEKYNRGGHAKWDGRVYGGERSPSLGSSRWHVYYGPWGSALFQRVYASPRGMLRSLPLTAEW